MEDKSTETIVTAYQLFQTIKQIKQIFREEMKVKSFNYYNDEFDFLRHCIDEAQRFNDQEVYGQEDF